MNKVHLALNTNKFEESVKFYQAFLGTEPEKLKNRYAKFTSENIPINLTLNEVDEAVTPSQINHLGIEVNDNKAVFDAIQGFKDKQLNTLEEIDTNCCYANQDKVWVDDPDGNSWEVFYVKKQLEDFGDSSKGCCQ